MVACTRKEASCILGNFFGELCPICEICRELLDDELALKTASGLTLEGEAVLVIEGHSSITGKPAKVKLTDYGFECVSLLYFKGEVILRLVSDGVKTVTSARPALSYWEAGGESAMWVKTRVIGAKPFPKERMPQ